MAHTYCPPKQTHTHTHTHTHTRTQARTHTRTHAPMRRHQGQRGGEAGIRDGKCGGVGLAGGGGVGGDGEREMVAVVSRLQPPSAAPLSPQCTQDRQHAGKKKARRKEFHFSDKAFMVPALYLYVFCSRPNSTNTNTKSHTTQNETTFVGIFICQGMYHQAWFGQGSGDGLDSSVLHETAQVPERRL